MTRKSFLFIVFSFLYVNAFAQFNEYFPDYEWLTIKGEHVVVHYHPEAESFLLENTKLNHGKIIPFIRTGWEDEDSGLGRFDLIIGSDLLYERNHAEKLSCFIDQHADKRCEVILVDPGRGNHPQFSRRMVQLGYSHSRSRPENTLYLAQPFRGQILRYNK